MARFPRSQRPKRNCIPAEMKAKKGREEEAGEREVRMPSEAKIAETYVEKPKTLAELRTAIAEGRVKAADLAAGYYNRIARINSRLNIYLSLTKERAFAQAERIDALAAKGDPLPALAGIPVGIKDVLVMQIGRAHV